MKDTSTLKSALKKGFIQIFSASFINKIIQFGITIVLSRILSKSLYGSFTYAQNILNMFLLLEGLGMVPGILQYCSMEKDTEKKLSYLKYALNMGGLVNLLICICVIIFASFFELPVAGSSQILLYLSLVPLMTIFFNEIQTFLRTELRNKEYSILTVTNTLAYFLGNAVLGFYFSIKGIVIGRYISYIISIAMGIYMMRGVLSKLKNISYPEQSKRREFLKYSIVCCLTNSMSQLLYLMDTFFVGLITQDGTVVASYKNATLIPFNLTFIPMSIMTFAYPYFAQHYDDKKWLKEKYNTLEKYLLILNGFITLILIIFAPQIVNLIFTKQYSDSIINFRILSFGYFVAGTFRITSGGILASVKKIKVNFYNSVVSGLANVVLDVVLIYKMGSIGASIATVSVYILSSAISSFYLRKYINS
ncbi:oligosaccharide flippase family protein [Clostridium lundense]|uniref:oligosaccharide flippase family protein n=1 Tax=Clostridium lundense TaxID=319475 RepID=UPI0004852FCF|nr:oligosaccharide flippase family protein [Clostridium lundense]